MTHHEKTLISAALTKAEQVNSEYRAFVAEQIEDFCNLQDGHNLICRAESGLLYDVYAYSGQLFNIEREGARPATCGDIAYLNVVIENYKSDRAKEEAAIAETEAMLFITER